MLDVRLFSGLPACGAIATVGVCVRCDVPPDALWGFDSWCARLWWPAASTIKISPVFLPTSPHHGLVWNDPSM